MVSHPMKTCTRVAVIVIFLVTLHILWAYLWFLLDASPEPTARIETPTLSKLWASYYHHNRNLADVDWHLNLISDSYEVIDSRQPGFDWARQRNWAYFPLHPIIGKALVKTGMGPFVAILTLSAFGVIALVLSIMKAIESDKAGPDASIKAAILAIAFIIPPLGFFANFVVLPSAIFAIIYLLFRRAMTHNLSTPSYYALFALLISSGIARVQGLIFNAMILSCYFAALVVGKRARLHWKRSLAIVFSALMPFAAIPILYQFIANDPLAFEKIQVAWGRTPTLPWDTLLAAFRSGAVINFGNGTELPFTTFRLILFAGVFGCGLIRVIRRPADNPTHLSVKVFDTLVLGAGMVLVLTAFSANTVMSAHRYMTCGAVLVVAALQSGWRPSWALVCGILMIRMCEFVLFARGYMFLIW